MPAHRANGVPRCMFFATHFYFCFYHVLSNCALRFIATGYALPRRASLRRGAEMAYFTAFAETLTSRASPTPGPGPGLHRRLGLLRPLPRSLPAPLVDEARGRGGAQPPLARAAMRSPRPWPSSAPDFVARAGIPLAIRSRHAGRRKPSGPHTWGRAGRRREDGRGRERPAGPAASDAHGSQRHRSGRFSGGALAASDGGGGGARVKPEPEPERALECARSCGGG